MSRWMLSLLALSACTMSACTKDPVIVEIPGRNCAVKLNLTQPPEVDALTSDLAGDEGRFSAIELQVSRGAHVQQRTLSAAQGDTLRIDEPLGFTEEAVYDLELRVLSPGGAVFSLGRARAPGCGKNQEEVAVTVPIVPVNRWIPLPAPSVSRLGHRALAVSAGVVIAGGARQAKQYGAVADAGQPLDGGPVADAGANPDGGAAADAGVATDGGPSDAAVAPDQDAGAEPDAGLDPPAPCTASAGDQLLGEPAQAGLVVYDSARLRFIDQFQASPGREVTQIPNLMGAGLYRQTSKDRALIVGGINPVSDSLCDPPLANYHYLDFSQPEAPRLTSLTWEADQRDKHETLQGLAFSTVVPAAVAEDTLVMLGGYRRRAQVAPGTDWPPVHDPPARSLPSRMVVVAATSQVTLTESQSPSARESDNIYLPLEPVDARFGDGSSLLLGGRAVGPRGVGGASDAAYHLLYSNQTAGNGRNVPRLYAGEPLSRARVGGDALAVAHNMVLVIGGLDGPEAESLELYRWAMGGRPAYREGGTLSHHAVASPGDAAVWDRGFAAATLPCAGRAACPVMVVGGLDAQGQPMDRAILLHIEGDAEAGFTARSEAMPAALPAPRQGATLTVLDDGSVLLAGGSDRADGTPATEAFLYQPYSP